MANWFEKFKKEKAKETAEREYGKEKAKDYIEFAEKAKDISEKKSSGSSSSSGRRHHSSSSNGSVSRQTPKPEETLKVSTKDVVVDIGKAKDYTSTQKRLGIKETESSRSAEYLMSLRNKNNQIQGEPSTYERKGDRFYKKESTYEPQKESVVQAAKDTSKYFLSQEQLFQKETMEPRFGSIGFGQGAMITYGEKQADTDLARTFQSDRASGLKDVQGLYDEPDYRSTSTKIIEGSPIIGSGINLLKQARGMSGAVSTQISAETGLGVGGASQREALKAIGGTTLAGGLFSLDVGMVGGAAKYGLQAGKTSLSKSLSKELSIGAEQLSKAPVVSGSIVDIESGKFAQEFSQKAGAFQRKGLLFGQTKETSSGMLFIPSGKGLALTGGKAELKGSRRLASKIFGGDKEKFLLQAQKFDVSNIQISAKGGKAFGFDTSRSLGAGVFTPTKTVTGIGGRSGVLIETRLGDTAVSSGIKEPAFIKQFQKGSIGYSETRAGKGLQISTRFEKPSSNIVSLAKDKLSPVTRDKKFIEGFMKSEIKTTSMAPKVKPAVSKNGLVYDVKVKTTTGEIRTPQISKTLQAGFEKTQYKPRPFQFKAPKIGLGVKGATALSLGVRSLSLGVKGISGLSSNVSPASRLSPAVGSLQSQAQRNILKDQEIFKPESPPNVNLQTPISPNFVTPSFIPKVGMPIIPLPSLRVSKGLGVGKLRGGIFTPGYTQSFAGYSLGVVGKTKGIQIGRREIYTGLEIRGKKKKKK